MFEYGWRAFPNSNHTGSAFYGLIWPLISLTLGFRNAGVERTNVVSGIFVGAGLLAAALFFNGAVLTTLLVLSVLGFVAGVAVFANGSESITRERGFLQTLAGAYLGAVLLAAVLLLTGNFHPHF